MTGEQSRGLKVGERVCWDGSKNDQGWVAAVAWRGVEIHWDDGKKTSTLHNDMEKVERAPANL